MHETPLYIILPIVFLFMVFFVGGYVLLMFNIMRADHNDIKSRKEQGYNEDIIPKKKEISEETPLKKEDEKQPTELS
ncbi:MAG: Unknown protein [uncultured Sulfurovum sp.]|uniref:Uncharacterized protein n=1 Tax=uncultured Sulfurovum sp. TaxID=269237 RepID=A0A6S6T8E4_9BACT|nr:MAG: Unknown protein [uncultured Sulfurovum sp.]